MPGQYYYDAVQEMAERGLFYGTTNYTFSPDGSMTRAMLVTVLWRLAGEPTPAQSTSFTDIPSDSYYAQSVAWAYETGITQGITSTTFAPERSLTRQELATFLYRYAQQMGYSTTAYNPLSKFSDKDAVGDFALSSMRWAVGAKIIQGMDSSTLQPEGTATRAQTATMLSRFIAYYGI